MKTVVSFDFWVVTAADQLVPPVGFRYVPHPFCRAGGRGLVSYNNGRGGLNNRNRNDVMLPSSPNHSTFYEFDLVDQNQRPVAVNGQRHGFRLVIDVDRSNTPQVV